MGIDSKPSHTVAPEILLDYNGQDLHWEVPAIGEKIVVPADEKILNYHYATCLLLQVSKNLLNSAPFSGALKFTTKERVMEHKIFGPVVSTFWTAVQNTETLIEAYINFQNSAKSHDKIFFYGFDQHFIFNDYIALAKQEAPSRVLSLDASTGWNAVRRQYESPRMMGPQELIDFLLTNKVKRLVTNNNYLAEITYRHSNVILYPILKFLGIEIVAFDLDGFDYTYYLGKATTSSEAVSRLSIFEHNQRFWDETYELKNVRYISADFAKREDDEDSIEFLGEPYNILVASHSRIPQLLRQLNSILYIMESLDPNNQAVDFQIWYYAIRHLMRAELTEHRRLNLQQLEFFNTQLYHQFMNGLSFLKFETIDGLKTERKIEIYGDQDWGKIFPSYYQNAYLNEADYQKKFSTRKFMGLHLNENYTYLVTNHVFQRAVRLRAPFLCFPPIVRLPEWNAFSGIEYRNSNELHEKIEGINEIYKSSNLMKARSYHHEIILENVNQNLAQLIDTSHTLNSESHFSELIQRHDELFSKLLTDYMAKNETKLRAELETFIMQGHFHLPTESSRFRDRPFLKRLVELRDRSPTV